MKAANLEALSLAMRILIRRKHSQKRSVQDVRNYKERCKSLKKSKLIMTILQISLYCAVVIRLYRKQELSGKCSSKSEKIRE